ncbi:MAG: SDR family oxidoreductase [Synechococcales cyanobacterium CRU_2_2]|nr:SDR family oxidoreductase [Synechococcales cyanobacterium CRU_2_2]
MKVLLTGHLGYIGTVLVPLLLAKGHEVVGLDSDLFRGSTFGGGMCSIPELKQDIRDVVASDLAGFEAVLHLAGLSNDPLGHFNPQLTDEINHQATVRLAELAKAAGVSRFVFSSSCSNYGAGGQDWLTEDSPLNPMTPYGHSKADSEHSLNRLADDRFSPTHLRNATAFGASPRIRFDLVLNNLMAWAFTTGRVLIKSDGTPWRPIVHIEDIGRAFIAAMEAPREKIHAEAFNVGRNADNYRVREIADIVQETVPGCEIEYAAGGGPGPSCYRVDCSKIERVLPEFQPQWDARKGAQQLLQAFHKVGLTLEEFEGPRYNRIDHVHDLIGRDRLSPLLRWQD